MSQILVNAHPVPLIPSHPLPTTPRVALTPDQLHFLLLFARIGCEHTISKISGHAGLSATFRELLAAHHPPTILSQSLITSHDVDLLLESIHTRR